MLSGQLRLCNAMLRRSCNVGAFLFGDPDHVLLLFRASLNPI